MRGASEGRKARSRTRRRVRSSFLIAPSLDAVKASAPVISTEEVVTPEFAQRENQVECARRRLRTWAWIFVGVPSRAAAATDVATA